MLNALQINKKNDTLLTFPSSNGRNFEDSGIVLAISVSQFLGGITPIDWATGCAIFLGYFFG